jgi:hypothetical protein
MSANTISVASVLANDTLDGVQANVYTVILTQISSTSPKVTQITGRLMWHLVLRLVITHWFIRYVKSVTNCATASVTVPITVLATTCFEYNGFYEYRPYTLMVVH